MSQKFVVILAGGKGERFWPLSRNRRPKQLLPIVGDRPMLVQTLDRVKALVPRRNVFVITNAAQAAAVRTVCPRLPAENVIAEPVGRDSAPAVLLAAALVEQRDAHGTFAILAADHVIHDERKFRADLEAAFAVAAASDVLVTIGIKPTEPNTGYGYIKRAAAVGTGRRKVFAVDRFVEKPDRATAEKYLADGGYYWNAGMFVWSVPAILRAFETHAPALSAGLAPVRSALGRGRSLRAALEKSYPRLDKISVDYAIMEKARNVVVLPATFDWDDVGSWPAVARHQEADAAGNVRRGRSLVVQGSGNIVVSDPAHMVAVLGADNLIVVRTEDATLVCPRDRAQDIKALLKELAEDPRTAGLL